MKRNEEVNIILVFFVSCIDDRLKKNEKMSPFDLRLIFVREHVNIEVEGNDENVSFLKSAKEDYQCVICFDLLCEPVVIPECGHTCCKTCLR